jgi:type VI protein secretion system component Hcp
MSIFLKLDGIESDATDKNHLGSEGWIACDSYSGGTTRPMYVETGHGAQRETSSAEFEEVRLRMKMHKGSPKVFLASLLGASRKATIHVTRAGDTSGTQNYLEITLSDAYVTNYAVDYSREGGATPSESIALNFTKIEKRYMPNGPDGKAGSAVPAGFDLATGKKL